MSISVSCECGNRLLLSEDFAGERVNCPYCGREVEASASLAALPSSPPPSRRPFKRAGGAAGSSSSSPSPGPSNGAAARGMIRNGGLISPPFLRPYPRQALWRPANSGGVQLLIGLAAAFAAASAALHRLEGPVWGLTLAALGLLLSLTGFVRSLWRRQGLSTPGVAMLFCASLAGLIATEPGSADQLSAAWNHGLNGKGWGGPWAFGGPANAEGQPKPENDGAPTERETEGSKRGAAEPARVWSPNSDAIRQGDWEFRITRVAVGKPRVSDSFDTSNAITEWKSPGFLISLEVRNQSQSRTYDYKRFTIKLSDNLKGNYEPIELGSYRLVDRQTSNARLAPGHSLNDLLFFDPPRDGVDSYILILDARYADFGDPIQVRIPAEFVR